MDFSIFYLSGNVYISASDKPSLQWFHELSICKLLRPSSDQYAKHALEPIKDHQENTDLLLVLQLDKETLDKHST